MNILFISSFPILDFSGGVQTATIVLGNEFERNKNKVLIASFERQNKRPVHQFKHLFFPAESPSDPSNNRFIIKLVDEYKLDLIINQVGFNVPIMKVLITAKIPIYTVHHNCLKCLVKRYDDIYGKSLDVRVKKLIDRIKGWHVLKLVAWYRLRNRIKYILKHSERLVLLSDNYINELNYFRLSFRNNVVSIPNCLPSAVKSNLNNKKNIVLYIGRIEVVQKRVDRLLPIWLGLQEHINNNEWTLKVLGNGGYLNSLEKQFRESNLTNFSFEGHVSPLAYLSEASILIMTSDFEGFPMVLLEAIANGVVPIVYDSFESASELVKNNSTGYLIEPFDESLFVSRLAQLINDKKLRSSFAKNSLRLAYKFQPGYVFALWKALFEQYSRA